MPSFDDFGTGVLANILGCLPLKDITHLRRVCTTWRDAARETLVPLTDLWVNRVRKYNTMRVMSTALLNLQQISILHLDQGHKYNDGEDPDEEEAAVTANRATLDINIVSNFRTLRSLKICDAPLNGRYPVLFDFPFLQKLRIVSCRFLKWDLEMLEALPSLKELDCEDNPHLTGNLGSLRLFIDTLEKVNVFHCPSVEGNFMDLAEFPSLKWLDLRGTAVAGDIRDIRDIGEHDFPALEHLLLPNTVQGGIGYQFQLISDVPSFMHAIHLLLRRSPTLFGYGGLPSWTLSENSTDWYEYDWEDETGSPLPPFALQFIQAGSHLGWSWCTADRSHYCMINWLDPEPDSEGLQRIERYIDIDFYSGYHQPPTQEEYRRLCDLAGPF
jgi:hypothetical protein